MKAKVNYNDKEVEIELTEEQIEKINNTKFGDYRDIQTFENACEATGEKWTEPKSLPVDVIAYMKLRIIAKALNGGSWMTYEDTDEGKYYPWFNATGSASGFSFDVCYYDRSASLVGSRLTFKSAEIAKYAGSQFLEIYNQYIN
ncbi:MAG: hypothetical protein Q8K92_19840 [Leadbetterella sp.]|nr:hypothetical protein [Leadbetterella sp.]